MELQRNYSRRHGPVMRAALLAAAAFVAGCGGATHTVTVTRPQPSTTTETSTTPTTTSSPHATVCDAACATRVVAGHGYRANPSTYDPSRPLNVLLGVRTGTTDGTAQNAFFFWQGRYIGTDTA